MEELEKKVKQIEEILKDFPADVNTYILLRSLTELLKPTYAKLITPGNSEMAIVVAKQIKLINDIAFAIIELIEVRKANLKS